MAVPANVLRRGDYVLAYKCNYLLGPIDIKKGYYVGGLAQVNTITNSMRDAAGRVTTRVFYHSLMTCESNCCYQKKQWHRFYTRAESPLLRVNLDSEDVVISLLAGTVVQVGEYLI